MPGSVSARKDQLMLTVGDPFPAFDLPAVAGWEEPTFTRARSSEFAGQWLVVFFWPKDFTSVCPTEVLGFDRLAPELHDMGASVIGVSLDSEYAHRAWRLHNPHLRHLTIPLASDIRRDLVSAVGVLDRTEGVALRATFLVDPSGIIRHVSVHDLGTGRNVEEIRRTLAALLSDHPTPCGWQPGDPFPDGDPPATRPATDRPEGL